MPIVPKPKAPELDQWLLAHGGDLQQLHFAFSDGVCFANLLHKVYPQLVHPRNFFSCRTPILRYNNWKLLNQRVLLKVGLKQSTQTLRELANGTPGAIEPLLFALMQKQRSACFLKRNDQIDLEQLLRLKDKLSSAKLPVQMSTIEVENTKKLEEHVQNHNIKKKTKLQKKVNLVDN